MVSVLVVCTANVCRSPLTAALLSKHGAKAGIEMSVTSAGLLTDGQHAHPDTIRAGHAVGVDLDEHRSRRVSPEVLAWEGRDLVIAMTRKHLRELVVMEPSIWNHTVTLRELDRLIQSHGGPLPDMLAGRRPRDLVEDVGSDDVPDPVGASSEHHRALAAELDHTTERIVGWWQRTHGPAGSRGNTSPIGG